MDFKKLINDKLKELEEAGTLEKLVQENIEKSLKSAIDDTFGSWGFQKDIEKKVKEQMSPVIEELDLTCFQTILKNYIHTSVNAIVDKSMKEKVETIINEIMVNNYEGITINDLHNDYGEHVSDLLKDDYNRDDFECDEYGEYYEFVFDVQNLEPSFYGSNFDRYLLVIKKKEDDDDGIEALFSIYNGDSKKDVKTNLLELKIDGKSVDDLIDYSHFNDFERKLINIYLKKTDIHFGDVENINFTNSVEARCY